MGLLGRFIPGVAVWAFGSRVRGNAQPYSDLDLAVFIPLAQRLLVSDLRDALAESNLPFPVDLHVWDELPPSFQAIIGQQYVVLQGAGGDATRHSSLARDGACAEAKVYTTAGISHQSTNQP